MAAEAFRAFGEVRGPAEPLAAPAGVFRRKQVGDRAALRPLLDLSQEPPNTTRRDFAGLRKLVLAHELLHACFG